MVLNNGVYFPFLVIFFDRFESIKRWTLDNMFILFGIVAVEIDAAVYFFRNAMMLAEIMANGRLDYYLSLPRPVPLHTLGIRSISSGMGDATYGIMSFEVAGQFAPEVLARFALGCILVTVVFLSFLVLVPKPCLLGWARRSYCLPGYECSHHIRALPAPSFRRNREVASVHGHPRRICGCGTRGICHRIHLAQLPDAFRCHPWILFPCLCSLAPGIASIRKRKWNPG